MLGLGLAVALAFGAFPLFAQEPGTGKSRGAGSAPTATKSSPDPSIRRVPSGFGQVGLSAEQKEKIYQIREKHQARIDALQKQIERAQAEMLTECESVLNEAQKHSLDAHREASARSKKGKSAGSERPAVAKPGEKSGS